MSFTIDENALNSNFEFELLNSLKVANLKFKFILAENQFQIWANGDDLTIQIQNSFPITTKELKFSLDFIQTSMPNLWNFKLR